MVETIQWTDAGVVMIDQTRLPREQSFVTCRTYLEGADFDTVCKTLAATRPTAVNLFWAIERMKRLRASLDGLPSSEIIQRMVEESKQIRLEDIAICQAIGRHG